MQLIALRDIYRTPSMGDIQIEGQLNERHIHKGAVFSIGTADSLKKLLPEERLLVAQLVVSKAVGDATDPKVVKAVQDELAAEKRREASLARLDAGAHDVQVAGVFQELLKRVSARAAYAIEQEAKCQR